jgi:trimeric autotransporter adhesin
MKTRITSLIAIILLSVTTAFTQVPQAINFQAIARDASGNVMVNTDIQIQLSILDASTTGTVLYKELRAVTTNAYGSFSFQIGVNPYSVLVGKMTDINWIQGKKFLKIDYDPTNKLQFNLTLGTIEFVSVPYAFAAGSVYKIDVNNAVSGNVLRYNASSGNFEPSNDSYNDLVNKPSLKDSINKYSVLLTGNQTIAGTKSFNNDLLINSLTVGCGKSSYIVNTAFGFKALSANTTGVSNTAYGNTTLPFNTSGSNNTAIGASALYYNLSGIDNTANGMGTLYRNTSGNRNTALGVSALFSTLGNDNIGIGANALISGTGSYNIAIGSSSGYLNSYTNHNIFIGDSAGFNNSANDNLFIGHQTGFSNTTGVYNTVIGNGNFSKNTIGGNNTAVGLSALPVNTTGNDNTSIGYKSLLRNTTGGQNTAVGDQSLINNTTGINNTACGVGAMMGITTGQNNTAFGVNSSFTAGDLTNATAIGYYATVDASNKVRIGNTSVTVIEGQVPFTNASDRRLKKNIKDLNTGLDFVLKLRPVEYQMKKGDDKVNYGFIAQEVEALVGTNNGMLTIGGDTARTLGLRYTDFIAPMVKAMQELNNKNKALEEKIAKLEAAIEAIKQH